MSVPNRRITSAYDIRGNGRHLEVELLELELAVGAEILVAPAGGDLVVAVEPTDHAELLEELRRLREREERSGLQADRYEKVPRALGRALRHARRPDIDEVPVVHHAPDGHDHGVAEPEVALHPVAAHVEVAVPEPQHLVDVLADLERQRLGARDDRQHVDLDLDFAGRKVRVDGSGCAQHDLAFRLQDELAPDLVRERGRVGGALGVDHELHLPGEVPEVDEDEPAVVATRVGPAGDLDALACVGGTEDAAGGVAPAAHTRGIAMRLAARFSSNGNLASALNCSRTVTLSPSTMTNRSAFNL